MYADILELAVLALARIMCAYIHSSLILCQEKLVKNPPTHALTMAAVALTANPPVDIPAALQVGIDKLSSPLKTLLMGKVVPYIIQHRLGEDGYVTIEDLADRWDTPQIARTNGPAELGFRDGDNGFDAKQSSYASMKLYQVVRAAKDLLQGTPSSPSASGTTIGRGMPLTRCCVKGPSSKRSTWPSGMSPNLSIGTRAVRPS